MIQDLLKDKPNLLTTSDLIEIGFYSSENAAYSARRRKISSPPYIKAGMRVFYPKDEFLRFLENGGGSGSVNAGKGPKSWQGGAIKGSDRWKAKKENVNVE